MSHVPTIWEKIVFLFFFFLLWEKTAYKHVYCSYIDTNAKKKKKCSLLMWKLKKKGLNLAVRKGDQFERHKVEKRKGLFMVSREERRDTVVLSLNLKR